MKKILCLVLVFALALAPALSLAAGMSKPTVTLDGQASVEGLEEVGEAGNTVITVLVYFGYILAVVMVIWLGIQWLLATPAKKAELKGKLWSMAIGIILLVGAVTIIDLVWGAAGTFGK